MTGFQLAKVSLLRRPFPTILAVICIGSACLAADFLVSVVRSQTSVLQHLDSDYDLLIGPKSSGTELLIGGLGAGNPIEESIPFALVRFLDRRADLSHRIPIYSVGQFHDLPVVGTDSNYWERSDGFMTPTLVAGDLPSSSKEMVIGKDAALRLNLAPGDPLNIEVVPQGASDSGTLWFADFEISGIVQHSNGIRDNTLFLAIEAAWEYYRWKVEQGIEVEHKDLEAVSYILVSAVASELEFVESKVHEGSTVQVVRIPEELAFLKTLTTGANRVSNLFCVIVLLLASLTVTVSINARFDSIKQELGVLRALGYTRGELTTWLTLESFIPTLLAVILAISLELLFLPRFMDPSTTQWIPSPRHWPEIWNVLLWIFFLSISFIASGVPLYRLYRNDIGTAMEGV